MQFFYQGILIAGLAGGGFLIGMSDFVKSVKQNFEDMDKKNQIFAPKEIEGLEINRVYIRPREFGGDIDSEEKLNKIKEVVKNWEYKGCEIGGAYRYIEQKNGTVEIFCILKESRKNVKSQEL